MPVYIPLAVMAFPVVLLLVFLLVARTHRRVARVVATVPAGWVRASAPGVVVSERQWRTRTVQNQLGALVRQPVVTYRPGSGPDVTFVSGIHGTFMPRPGTAVGVWYDPTDPQRARIAPESVPRTFRKFQGVAVVVGLVVFIPLAAVFELFGWFMLTA